MVCKVVTLILNFRLITSISSHNVLHVFQAGSGTGTASLEAKILHQLMSMKEEVMYEIFLYLHKVYDSFDRDICLEILDIY